MHKSSLLYGDFKKPIEIDESELMNRVSLGTTLCNINITLFKDCKILISDTDPIYLFIFHRNMSRRLFGCRQCRMCS